MMFTNPPSWFSSGALLIAKLVFVPILIQIVSLRELPAVAEKLGITLPSQNIELGTSHDFSWLVRKTTMHALRDDGLRQAEIAAKTLVTLTMPKLEIRFLNSTVPRSHLRTPRS